jgi:hypothetical protein
LRLAPAFMASFISAVKRSRMARLLLVKPAGR